MADPHLVDDRSPASRPAFSFLEPARKRSTGGRRGHALRNRLRPEPIKRSAIETAFDGLVAALFPWAEGEYLGLWRGAAALLKASPWTVRNWRRGRRKPPQWAVEVLVAELERRSREMREAIDAIRKEQASKKGPTIRY